MERKSFCLIWLILLIGFNVHSQDGVKNNYRYDTVKTKSYYYELIHYHRVDRETYTDLIFKPESTIFNEDNSYSRLIVKSIYVNYTIPTIPLSNLIFLEKKNLIIGLSNYVLSPYNIVIYSLSTGKLLYKSKVRFAEVSLSLQEIESLIAKYPEIRDCFKNSNVFKFGDKYHFEMHNCFSRAVGGLDSLFNNVSVINSIYFPNIDPTTMSSVDENGNFYLKPYNGFYDFSDPVYDILTIGNVPYLLILNSYDGSRVNIPLVSNCKNPAE